MELTPVPCGGYCFHCIQERGLQIKLANGGGRKNPGEEYNSPKMENRSKYDDLG